MTGVSSSTPDRWAWADVDLGAIAHNVALLRHVAGDAEVWAVVKADGYGHGAIEVARTALEAGAGGLCVALTQEALQLREAGLTSPILLLSQQPPAESKLIVDHGLTPTVYDATAIRALAEAADPATPLSVHLKVDTGMQRVGAQPDDAGELASLITASASLRLGGVFTHLAVADSDTPEHHEVTARQLARFDEVLDDLSLDDDVLIHAANSAGTLAHDRSRRRLVRVGIALYGISPGPGVDHLAEGLHPAMALRARVSFVKRVHAGSSISYGHRHTFERDTTVATVPIGYADGVPRRLGTVGGQVLVHGVRCPIVGVVTMDQLMVDVGHVEAVHGAPVRVGDDVTLIGEQGDQRIRAEDWAELLDTIGYEIVCGISSRVGRRHRAATP